RQSRYQAFATTGFEFVLARRNSSAAADGAHHDVFVNSGFAARAGQGWMVGEFSVSSNRWAGGDETRVALTPSYIWRLGRRTELLFGMPVGVTSSSPRIGA